MSPWENFEKVSSPVSSSCRFLSRLFSFFTFSVLRFYSFCLSLLCPPFIFVQICSTQKMRSLSEMTVLVRWQGETMLPMLELERIMPEEMLLPLNVIFKRRKHWEKSKFLCNDILSELNYSLYFWEYESILSNYIKYIRYLRKEKNGSW